MATVPTTETAAMSVRATERGALPVPMTATVMEVAVVSGARGVGIGAGTVSVGTEMGAAVRAGALMRA